MKSRLTTFLLLLAAMMIAAPQVSALDIRVLPNGRIEFYTGSVLGESDERNKREERRKEEKRPEVKYEKSASENRIRTVNKNENQELRVRARDSKVEVELRKKQPRYTKAQNNDFEKKETTRTDDLHLQFPVHSSRDQLEVAKKKQESMRETIKDELGGKLPGDEKRRQELKTRIETGQVENQKYWEKLKEERQGRKDEMVELKNKLKDKRQSLELKSRNVKAALENGAEFALDPTTNEVTVVTPSGQEHTLNHLPDQALERMQAAGLFNGTQPGSEEEIKVETNSAGELVYKKRDTIKKKVFGFIPRQVSSEIVLNDATGAVAEYQAPPRSLFEQFLNTVSF